MTQKDMLITLSSDFAVQSQGVGIMEAAALEINPKAKVVHLMHGLPDFDMTTAAWAMESIFCLNPGIHVCVVDPGVGTERKAIAILTRRGDILVGPDNGVLMPAARLLGGIVKAVSLEDEDYMRKPVSPIFHGRDIFTPAAAHLSRGVAIDELGPEIQDLVDAPYEEAKVQEKRIKSQVIHVNKFGSVHLNILQDEFDRLGVGIGDQLNVKIQGKNIAARYSNTFGEVDKGKVAIMKDDYMRIEIAANSASLMHSLGYEDPAKLMGSDVLVELS